jgi:hypothetical protein
VALLAQDVIAGVLLIPLLQSLIARRHSLVDLLGRFLP